MNDLARIAQERESLNRELAKIRRASMQASERRDFRTVARLTLEAARINRALLDAQTKEQTLR